MLKKQGEFSTYGDGVGSEAQASALGWLVVGLTEPGCVDQGSRHGDLGTNTLIQLQCFWS